MRTETWSVLLKIWFGRMKISVKSTCKQRAIAHNTSTVCIKICDDCPAIYNVEQQTPCIIHPSFIHPNTNMHISSMAEKNKYCHVKNK